VADVEPLRHGVEGKRDQNPLGSAGLLGVIQSPFDQFSADAPTLTVGRYEELRQKPDVAADPAPGEPDNPAVVLRDPESVGIVRQREQKFGGLGEAICPNPWRSVSSLMLDTTSASANSRSSARAGRQATVIDNSTTRGP
jgi:hypothetical protein